MITIMTIIIIIIFILCLVRREVIVLGHKSGDSRLVVLAVVLVVC